MPALRPVATDLWVAEQPLRFGGVEIGARMTVIRLSGGRLLLHSPIRPADALCEEIAGLGEVAWLVAPNRFHHLFIKEWAEAFPKSAMLIAPGLREKRPDLETATVLSVDRPPAGWAGEVEMVAMAGFPMVGEYVFFHRATATLVAADLAFNLGQKSPLLTRLFIRVTGRLGQLAPTWLEKFFIRDRDAFRACLREVLAWPFERVIVGHGDIVEDGGREALARGYEWLLRAG